MKHYKKIYPEDFQELLNIKYTDKLIIKTDKLKGWDPYKDKEYTSNPDLNDKLTDQFGNLISESYQAPMYMSWINKMVHYGVFAEKPLKKGDMVCEYTGYLEVDDGSNPENLYLWDYPTVLYETVPGKTRRRKVQFCVNAEKIGNCARGINHTIKKHQNVGVVMVLHKNLWHVVYQAKKDIAAGEQLLTHYGKSYWSDRNIKPAVLLP